MTDVHTFIRTVKNCIEQCIKEYMTEEQTIDCLWRYRKIPHHITSAMWRRLEKTNSEFFREYSLRLVLMSHIKTFNTLLDQQAELQQIVKVPPNNNYYCLSPPPPYLFDQKFQSYGNGELMRFSDMVPNNGAIALPQDSFPANPLCPVNGSPHMAGNIRDAPSYMISALDSNSAYGFSDGSFMYQNYPCGFSSTFPGNGNVPPLPMMHDSSLLSFSRNQIGGMSILQAHNPSNTDVHSPMNTEDENGTVTHLGFGRLTMEGSPSDQ